MAREHIVVDGSNIATEGRSSPSLAQLEEAVAELRRERPDAEVTVIVDATFSHRIDPSELGRFEEAALKGEYVHPPAGAIGRGDAFLLRIAEKVDAAVLSNDSFQEFHGEHPWLFERGRLFGATPVPGVGWIFSPRTPVRGPKSRKAVQGSKAADNAKRKLSKAIEAATKEAVAPKPKPRAREGGAGGGGRAGKRAGALVASVAAVNDPLTFISFIAGHPLGTEVTGEVESYTSHGAVVMVDGTQCYLPLANMAAPPPRSAREMLKKGERRQFLVTALDPQRRGVEIALPGVTVVSGRPSEETIAAELRLARKKAAPAKKAAAKKASPADKTAPARKAAPAKKAAPRTKTPEEKEGGLGQPRGGKEATKAPSQAKKAPSQAKKAPPQAKRAAPKRAITNPAPSETTRREEPPGPSPAKRATTPEKAAPAKRTAAPKKAAPAKKTAAKKAAPARKAAAKKAAPARKAAAKKAAPDSRAPRKKAARPVEQASVDEGAKKKPGAGGAAANTRAAAKKEAARPAPGARPTGRRAEEDEEHLEPRLSPRRRSSRGTR